MSRSVSHKFSIVLILLCFFNLVVFSELSIASGIDDVGYLKINAKHKGLEVKLDGKTIGYTPLNILAVPVGTHAISVAHFDKNNWLGKTWLNEVMIADGDTAFLQVNFKKSLSVNSSPYEAEVFIENRFVGETPFFFEMDEGESTRITLKKRSYKDTTFTINATDFEKIHVQLNEVTKTKNMILHDRFEGAKVKTNKNRFLWTLGASVLSGALTLYFRTKADDKYNRYRKTGNPDSFNGLYDDAKKLDKFAAVSYGTFQVSFVFSFYFFFAYKNQ